MWQMFFQAILRSLFIYGMRYRIIALALSLLINVLYPVIGLADTFQSASFYLQNLPMCWILVILIFHRETLAVDISSSDENTSHVPKGVMKEIIDNIPSGIIFYSEQNGIFEANRQWQNIQSQLRRANLRKKMPKSRLWKQNLSISEFSEREKTENTFKYFHNSENTKESLLDIVRQIHHSENKGKVIRISKYSISFTWAKLFKKKSTQILFAIIHVLFIEVFKSHKISDAKFINEEVLSSVDMSGKSLISNTLIKYNEGVKKVDEIALIWNMFSPPKEFVAYICLWAYPTDDNTVMVVLSDVSERIDLQASKVSEKIKTIMFCSISHELRSPLNHISGVHSLLKAKLVTEEQEGLLRIAESSTEILKIKIDDILDFYELESASFQLQRIPFDVRHQWKELETVFLPLMNARRTKLLFYVNEQTPKLLTHDACRIHKVLVNLISNAVKYTRSGAVVVSVDWKEAGRGEGAECEIKYSVSDTGRGISKEKKQSLFKFLDPDTCKLQEDSKQEETTQLAGTGLGISQKIMEKLGTKIEYTSTLGIGSTFWFILKLPLSWVQYYEHHSNDIKYIKDHIKRNDSFMKKSLIIPDVKTKRSVFRGISYF